MRRLEELLLTKQSYKIKLTEIESSVVHNKASIRRKRYIEKCVRELDKLIIEELDNEL